jgi:hypothetical protein
MFRKSKPFALAQPLSSARESHEMFRVDVGGLRRKFAHRPKSFLLFEVWNRQEICVSGG